MDTETPIHKPEGAARFVASKPMRFALIGGVIFLVSLVVWRMFAGSKDDKPVKSKAETDLEKIMATTGKEGKTPPDNKTINGKGAEQPAGDQEAMTLLNQGKADGDAKDRRKMEAEQRMMAALAWQNYNRKIQGLKYDAPLAAEWERKMAEAQRNGQAPPTPPASPLPEDFEELKQTRPDLYNKWVQLRGEPTGFGSSGSITANAPGGKPGAPGLPAAGGVSVGPVGPQAAQGAMPKPMIPVGIDPKTGLPTGVAMGDQNSMVYSLLDDGSPDIGNGAIPVQIQYVPPGATQAVTVIKWLRPGYLTGRNRPYDPAALKEEDDSYRRSLKDSTEVPVDSQTVGVSIPYRYTNNRVKATATTDFKFQNHYVVVLPNPNGKLDPANPPAQP